MFQNTANNNTSYLLNWIFQAAYQGDATGSVLIAQIKHTTITMLSVALSS